MAVLVDHKRELNLTTDADIPKNVEIIKGLYFSMDSSLEPQKNNGISREKLLQLISEQTSENCNKKSDPLKNNKTAAAEVHNTSIPLDGIFFRNYLDYIRECYANHYVPIIAPEYISFAFFSTISKHVVDYPDNFRSLFTKKESGKTVIEIPFTNNIENALTMIMDEVNKIAPIDIFHLLPNFSTDTISSKMARISAFAEMISPYYSYMMYCCGFPGINITGTTQDWKKLLNTIQIFRTLFGTVDKTKSLEKYFLAMTEIVQKLHDQIQTGKPDAEFLNNFFINTTCGSGHQEAIDGWICKIHNIFWRDNRSKQPPMPNQFPPQITSVPYTIKYNEGERNFLLHYGLHFGKITNNNNLIPEYHWTINKV